MAGIENAWMWLILRGSWIRLGMLVVLGSALGGIRGGPDRVETLQPPSQPIPRTLFGLHIHRLTDTTPWPTVPFGTWRLWDAYAAWPNVEARKGRWDFSRVDTAVSTGASPLLLESRVP